MKRFPPYIKYIVTFCIGACISAAVFAGGDLFTLTDKVDVYRVLCNGFFISGALIAGFGLLTLCSVGGTFDMLMYGVFAFFSLFSRSMKTKYGSFYDYRVAKNEKRPTFLYLLIVGALYLAAAVVFLVLFYMYY